jgi:tRNA pseudouridine(38-40) synthase
MIKFSYCVSLFYGLQPLVKFQTAGVILLELLTEAAQETPKALCFSARTDKGVSAIENIATCWFQKPFDVFNFLNHFDKLNKFGLRNIKICEVDANVHARGNSRGKHYRYIINSTVKNHSWRIFSNLNIFSMKCALKLITGTHDFRNFTITQHSACSTVKTIYKAELIMFETGEIWIEILGNSFLRKMVRMLVGFIVEIGIGLREIDEMVKILKSKNRNILSVIAPSHGLTLVKVDFRTNYV